MYAKIGALDRMVLAMRSKLHDGTFTEEEQKFRAEMFREKLRELSQVLYFLDDVASGLWF